MDPGLAFGLGVGLALAARPIGRVIGWVTRPVEAADWPLKLWGCVKPCCNQGESERKER